MVQQILNIFNKEFGNIHQAAYLLGGFALLSQLLALFRDRLLAYSFGAGAELDIYYAAFRIPDFIYVGIASFVSLTVLIPFLVERLDSRGEYGGDRAHAFISTVFSVFFVAVVLVCGAAFLFAPALASVIVPGFSESAQETFVMLTRILLLSPILLGFSSLLGSITQAYRKFFVYASAPVLYNVGIIAGIIFLLPHFGITGVVYGVIIGAMLHLAIQIPVVIRHGLLPRPSLNVDWNEIGRIIKLSLPRTIALSANHLTLIVLIALASFIAEGSIAVFQFAYNLQSVPLAIIGVSYSVAAFPTLAKLFSKGEQDKFVQQIAVAARHIIFWSVPAIVLFVILRAQIVRTVLGSGSFDWADTRLTAAALALFAISIVAQALQLLFVRGYYAAGKTRVPLIAAGVTAMVSIGGGYLLLTLFSTSPFMQFFLESLLRIEELSGTAIISLPFAFSIGALLGAGLLWAYFVRDFRSRLNITKTLRQSFSASIIMGFVAYQFLVVFGDMFDIDTFWGIFAQGFFAGTIGIAVGILVLYMVGSKELQEVWNALHRRIWGARAVAPDQEEL